MLGGKSAADLQENIVIDNFHETITGTLHYVTGYTQFSGAVEEQSGNYLVWKVESDNSATLYVWAETTSEWKALDDDGLVITRVTDKTKPLKIKAVKDGQDNVFEYDLSGLTLEASS